MFDNLRTTEIPPGYPKVDLDQTRGTLKEGSPTKGTFTSNFGHARQRAQYNNYKGMYDHIDIMMDKFAKEEETSYHLCFDCSFMYFTPSIMMALLGLIIQTQKFRIIIDPTNTIFEGNTGNTNAQMPKPGVDHQRNLEVYYGKSLLYHLVYIWNLRQRHPDHGLFLYKDDINTAFCQILYHLDIAPAFAIVLQHMLCIPVGIIFGAGFSSSLFCNTSETRVLATMLRNSCRPLIQSQH
jgi:hypothetical protein